MGADDIERCKPIYETIAGWSDSTVGVTRFEKLPTNARLYLQRIEQVTGVPIHMVSTGPDREQTILLRHPYLLD
jgi:adenylosuccinate synthase